MAIVDKPWVPIRTDLEHDPRVIAIARACDKSLTIVQPEYRKHVVCWGLKLVWSYFVTHSIDGVVDGLTAEDIDAIAGVPGLARAMAAPRRNESPWLILNTDGATIPDFGKWHWKTLRKTEQNAQRQRDFKQRSRGGNAHGNANERYQNVTSVYTKTKTETKTEEPAASSGAQDWEPPGGEEAAAAELIAALRGFGVSEKGIASVLAVRPIPTARLAADWWAELGRRGTEVKSRCGLLVTMLRERALPESKPPDESAATRALLAAGAKRTELFERAAKGDQAAIRELRGDGSAVPA